MRNKENESSKTRQAVKMVPLVTSQVSSSAESINTILNDYENGVIFIPEYQRDSDQWSDETKSLFIDSILNNITTPSLIFSPDDKEEPDFWMKKLEIVDGQQRTQLLHDFFNNKFKLLPSDKVSYISEHSIYYAGKYFNELPKKIQNIFLCYKFTIIQLPQDITRAIRLETFRRLDQQPYILSAQDIRLSQYSFGKITKFIRVTGITDFEKDGSKRMLDYASEVGINWPWANYNQEMQDAWYRWWEGKKSAKGQRASEMFLWYIIGLYYNEINEILCNRDHLMSNLNMTFLDNIDNIADIALAHLNYEENNEMKKLCSLDELESKIFPKFAIWFDFFYKHYPSAYGFNVQKYKLIAFIFAALYKYYPDMLQEDHINQIDKFLFKPRETSAELGINYPETKGKWNSQKGLYNQIESIHAIINNILE